MGMVNWGSGARVSRELMKNQEQVHRAPSYDWAKIVFVRGAEN